MPGVMGDDALIAEALRRLGQAWSATADGWRDQAREEFARLHLDGIEQRAREAARAIKRVETLIAEVDRQCR